MDPVESKSSAIWGRAGMKVPATKTNQYIRIHKIMLEICWIYIRGIKPVRDTIARIPLFLAGAKRL